MNTEAFVPPQPPACLTQSYESRAVRGGTAIAEDVLDRQTHDERILDPDGYRGYVSPCRRCGSGRLHAHCFRDRTLRPGVISRDELVQEITIRLYLCAEEDCGAVFTVLPAFVARHLWRAWTTVDEVTQENRPAARTTAQRWHARLKSDASQLTQLFLTFASSHLQTALTNARPATRQSWFRCVREFLPELYRTSFALAAAWVHRATPGIRLM